MSNVRERMASFIEGEGHRVDATPVDPGSGVSELLFRTRGQVFSVTTNEKDAGLLQYFDSLRDSRMGARARAQRGDTRTRARRVPISRSRWHTTAASLLQRSTRRPDSMQELLNVYLGDHRALPRSRARSDRRHRRSYREQGCGREIYQLVHDGGSVSDTLTAVEPALEDEGLYFTRDDDEDAFRIAFKSEGDRYFVVSYRDDPTFMMIGSGWALPPEIDPTEAIEVANRLNVRKKFVKTALWQDERDVLFTVELCVSSSEEVRPHFGRLLDVLRDTAVEFFESTLRRQAESLRRREVALVRVGTNSVNSSWKRRDGAGRAVAVFSDDELGLIRIGRPRGCSSPRETETPPCRLLARAILSRAGRRASGACRYGIRRRG